MTIKKEVLNSFITRTEATIFVAIPIPSTYLFKTKVF